MDAVPWSLIGSVGGPASGWVLVTFAVWMILTGRLIPRTIHEETRAEADTWRRAYEAERDRTSSVLVPSAELQRDVLSALPMPRRTPTEEDPCGD